MVRVITFLTLHRNRYLELQKYSLDLDEKGDLKDFSIDERQVAVMRLTGRIELPESYIKGIRVIARTGNSGKELICRGYRISNRFPDNIVLLQNKKVLYCIDFHEEPDPQNPGFPKFFLTGQ
jgi:hypothetical protein